MNHRPGFTLLELVLATVLSVLLMVGVLGVIASLKPPAAEAGAAEPLDRAEEAPEPPPALDGRAVEAFVHLLRDDLSRSARAFERVEGGGVFMYGLGALDADSREPTMRPADVSYAVESVDGRSWLVRRQAALDVKTNRYVQRDLVLAGVARLSLEPRSAATDGPGDSSAGGRAGMVSPGAAPSQAPFPASSGGSADGDQAPSDLESMPVVNSPDFVRWLLRRQRALAAEAGESESSDDPGAAATGPAAAELGADEDDLIGLSMPNVWRLRCWAADAAEPVLERTIILRSVRTP